MFEFWIHGNGFIDVKGTFLYPCLLVLKQFNPMGDVTKV
jgi:hypothetical protein